MLWGNGSNLVNDTKDLGLPGIACVAHSLNLAVLEGLMLQNTTGNAVGGGWKIAGHFKHSLLAYSQLEGKLAWAKTASVCLHSGSWSASLFNCKSIRPAHSSRAVWGVNP